MVASQPDNSRSNAPTIPNVDGMSLLDAGLAYADTGIYRLFNFKGAVVISLS